MKLNRKPKTGMVDRAPQTNIGEAYKNVVRGNDRMRQVKSSEIPIEPTSSHIKRDKRDKFVYKKKRSCLSFNCLFLVAVGIIVLSMCAALIVYFSNPQSPHKEALQKTLVETLIIACMLGIGTIFGLLGAKLYQ
jgi:hypothetical protein